MRVSANSRGGAAKMNREAIDAAIRQIRDTLDALAPLGESEQPSTVPPTDAFLDGDGAAPARIAELERQLAARDEFLATISHELRNPLTPLLFQTRVIAARLASDPTQPPSPDWIISRVRRLEHQLQRVNEVLDRLLDLSRLASGRIDLRLEEVNLTDVLRDVIASFEPELAIAACEVRFEANQPVVGRWDGMRIEQICRNLLSNAIRYGASRPIDVRIDGDDFFAVLEVRDYGVGIDPQHQQKIFERFERGAVDRRGGGFGVGLWVVKNICLAFGGTVSVESEPGKGAKFVVILPRNRGRREERTTARERYDA
jgi:signal transduction histidine kinase